MGELKKHHRADLESSGLTRETIALSGCRSVTGAESRRFLGYSAGAGLSFPYLHTAQNGDEPYKRLKPDRPFVDESGRPSKYLSPKRERNPDGNRLYLPPNLPDGVLQDPKVSLLVTEGEKKALAGNQEGFVSVGLPGVACFVSKGKGGESRPIDDLNLIEWKGREVHVVFDSDATTKVEVNREEKKLAQELQLRGADTRIARLPRPTAREDRDNNLGGKFGMDDFLKVRGKAAFAEILRKAKSVRASHGIPPRVVAADLAEQFLAETVLRKDNSLRLRWWRETFYRFTGAHYEEVPDGDLRARVNQWLQSDPRRRGSAGTRTTTTILQNIQALTLVDAAVDPPAWLNGNQDDDEYLALSNGLIRVADLLDARLDEVRPLTPDYFALSSLPFPVDPEADCSRWFQFLDEMLPDPNVQTLLQEIFGYLLVHDTTQEKFFLFVGSGSNGKSVVCTVLGEILGESNVSGVALEAFSSVRTFPLADTIGKKANIVEELEDSGRIAEGVLKNYVTGKRMTIEQKHRNAFSFKPTARLVFATNVVPRFVDTTDGIWRRLCMIQFEEQILDEAKRDERLIDEAWWRASGELPAVFLWSVGGLVSLRRRGHFIEPEACKRHKQEYRRESNPIGTFLGENCEIDPDMSTPSRVLYTVYSDWAKEHGHKPVASARFAREVRRIVPAAQLSEHPQRTPYGRTRVWAGLHLLREEVACGTARHG